jgi:hypothetical protein
VAPSLNRLLSVGRDVASVLACVREVEQARVSESPERTLPRLRARGRMTRKRSTVEQQRLRGVIRFVDRLMPGGDNCYRRVLLEMAVDADAATKPVVFGLKKGGGLRSGHAWFRGREDDDPRARERYDAEFVV